MLKVWPSLIAIGFVLASVPPIFSKEENSAPTPQINAAPSASTLRLEFNTSEPLGLLRFINGICKQSDEGQAYYDFLISHHKLDKDDKELTRLFVTLRKSKSEFETKSGRKLSLHQQLMASACFTKSFDDFFKSAKAFCDADEFETLELVMNHFRPIYEQLIWKPLSPQLNKDLAWFRENEQAFARPLETEVELFQSSAGRDQALKAMLIPVPTEVKKEGNGYNYISSGNSENLDLAVVLSVGIIPQETIASFNDTRVNNDMALADNDGLIHEFVHTLWAFRNPEFKRALIACFEKDGRQFNYDLLNESQAAAIQAWFHKQVSGKDKSGRWYSNRYVDKYAKALLPVLQEYANTASTKPASTNSANANLATANSTSANSATANSASANSISLANSSSGLHAEDYAEKAMKAFDMTFPNWQEDPQIILWRSQVVQSPLSSDELVNQLNDEMFEYSGGEHKVSSVKGETWPDKFKQYSKNPTLTTVFLMHPNQIDTLQKYFELDKKIANELESLLSKNQDSDSDAPVVKAVNTGRQWLIFSISNKQALQKQGLLDYANPSSKRLKHAHE